MRAYLGEMLFGLLAAPVFQGLNPSLGTLKGNQRKTRARRVKVEFSAYAGSELPVPLWARLRDDETVSGLRHYKMAGLPRLVGEIVHQRLGLCDEAPCWRVTVGKQEHLHRQGITIAAFGTGDISPCDEPFEHAKDLRGAQAHFAHDFRSGHAAALFGQNLEDIQPLIQGRRSVFVVLFLLSTQSIHRLLIHASLPSKPADQPLSRGDSTIFSCQGISYVKYHSIYEQNRRWEETMRLQGKTILVTAAGQGIGRASALACLKEGANVIATDANESLFSCLDGMETAALDVRDPEAIKVLASRVGPLDGLFNCAGFVHHGTLLDVTDDDWAFSFDLNVTAMMRLARACLPGMLERAAETGSASILNMASMASSIKGFVNRTAYGAAKLPSSA